jgi:hypothetical protein
MQDFQENLRNFRRRLEGDGGPSPAIKTVSDCLTGPSGLNSQDSVSRGCSKTYLRTSTSTRAIRSRVVASPLDIRTYFCFTLFLAPVVFSPPLVLISAK